MEFVFSRYRCAKEFIDLLGTSTFGVELVVVPQGCISYFIVVLEPCNFRIW